MNATTAPPEPLCRRRRARGWFRPPRAFRALRSALRASGSHFCTVWLVLVRPVEVEWGQAARVYAATRDWGKADRHYQDAVAWSYGQGGSDVVQLVPWHTSAHPHDLADSLVTGQLPVAREFRPA